MSVMTHDLLVRGTAAAKAGEKAEAIRNFKWLLDLDPTLDEQIAAWHWLSELVDKPGEKKSYLDEILARNPGDARARRTLAALSGDLKPEEVINPDRSPKSQPTQPVRTVFQRLTCQKCGARMTYSADGREVVCENCGSRRPAGGISSRTTPPKEANFAAVLATAPGHSQPIRTKIITCGGCGAEFVISARSLSTRCPYCGTGYAGAATGEKDILPPTGLLPFTVSLKDLREILREWLQNQKALKAPSLMDPEGFYFPAWCFTMGGQLKWSCSIQQNDRSETVHDSKILLHTDILVAATRRIPEGIAGIVKTYQLRDLISFDPHYLADWNAETYQITVSDASLTARKMVLDSEKKQISDQYDSRILNLKIDSTSMAVDTVKLILLPVWITSYQQNGVNFDIAVNGQNGRVVGQQPAPGLSDWINEIFSK